MAPLLMALLLLFICICPPFVFLLPRGLAFVSLIAHVFVYVSEPTTRVAPGVEVPGALRLRRAVPVPGSGAPGAVPLVRLLGVCTGTSRRPGALAVTCNFRNFQYTASTQFEFELLVNQTSKSHKSTASYSALNCKYRIL